MTKTKPIQYNAYEKPIRCKYSEEGLWDLISHNMENFTYRFNVKLNKRGHILGERPVKDVDASFYVVKWDGVKAPDNVAKDYIEIL